ncbi:VWA domain-containing protein [Engelhardtia mirabilis]|uniref:von Willebrand factor type A domain protein n=1 Tax=Engelhardtia mirabilis TaxID=2528011 RepID=A0A518BNG3_9BACT|nr:von Willebrand factor type A domain protein [Planctomycetes bacterium Pla133]QDV02798.1 von Willebrand factor type A domain protein [Planctomycetes bacterium Pla86]
MKPAPVLVSLLGLVASQSAFAAASMAWEPAAAVCTTAPRPSPSAGRATRLIEAWGNGSEQTRARVSPELLASTIDAMLREERGDDRRRADVALLTLAGVTSRLEATPHDLRLRREVIDGLIARKGGRGGDGFREFVLADVLLLGASMPTETRRGACMALALERTPAALLPLLSVARDPDLELRAAALVALTGWPERGVGEGFVRAVVDAPAAHQGRFMQLALGHLHALHSSGTFDLAWPDDLGLSLGDEVLGLTLDRDWRRASPAVALAAFVPAERSVPVLIEALGVWTRREGEADRAAAIPGARRLRFECADTLESLTGRPIGPSPERWRDFWSAVREGTPLTAANGADGSRATVASFFGLRLRSGSVAFVVDASGSMEASLPNARGDYGTSTQIPTRFQAASGELLDVLAASPDPTQFGVVLFSDQAVSWKGSPTRADEDSLRRLRSWLGARHPDGGTQLATGLHELIDSVDDLHELEFDTVVVLCDGETTEDGTWARDWLLRFNPEAQLVFHCVQIGGARADALRALASGTGGSFLRVEG